MQSDRFVSRRKPDGSLGMGRLQRDAQVGFTAGVDGLDGDMFGSVSAGLAYRVEDGFILDDAVFPTVAVANQTTTAARIGIRGQF